MSAVFPVWPTTKAILLYCWQERALAVRYAIVPVILLILLDAGGTVAGIDIAEDRVWQIVTTILTLLAYAPLMVSWYRAVVFGEDEARRRPMFIFGQLEGAVLMTNILVALVVGASIFPLGAVVAVGAAIAAQINQVAGQITAVVLAIPAVFVWLMILSRLSVAIAFSAAGRHLGVRDTWRLTKPIGVPLTWVHIILGILGLGVSAAATGLVGAGLEAVGFGAEEGQPAPVLDLAVSAADTIFGLLYLLFATTLFGLVYRQLAPRETT